MHRKRRHRVNFGITHFADLAPRVNQIVRIGKFAHHGVNLVLAQAQFVFDLLDIDWCHFSGDLPFPWRKSVFPPPARPSPPTSRSSAGSARTAETASGTIQKFR